MKMSESVNCCKFFHTITVDYYKVLPIHVEYCSSIWNPYYSKDKELLAKVQHRYTKMIINMQDKAYEERLWCLGLWTLEERRNRQDLIEVFKMFRGLVKFRCKNSLCWM